jgi:hypothetical protein
MGAAFDRSLRRRHRFWLRFAGIVIAIMLPELAAVVAPVGEQTFVMLTLLGLAWGILLLVPSWLVLFQGWGLDPGSGDDDGEGPGPEDERPPPPSPIGGIPLPEAEPSSARVRDHRPRRRAARPRRAARERERPPYVGGVPVGDDRELVFRSAFLQEWVGWTVGGSGAG